MDYRTLLHQLLYHALIDIREAAYEGNIRAAFKLSDLIHNLPLQLERVMREDGDYREIFDDLRTRGMRKGFESWIENALGHYVSPRKSVPQDPTPDQRTFQEEKPEFLKSQRKTESQLSV